MSLLVKVDFTKEVLGKNNSEPNIGNMLVTGYFPAISDEKPIPSKTRSNLYFPGLFGAGCYGIEVKIPHRALELLDVSGTYFIPGEGDKAGQEQMSRDFEKHEGVFSKLEY